MNCSPQSAPWTGTSPAYTPPTPIITGVTWGTPTASGVVGTVTCTDVGAKIYQWVINGQTMPSTSTPSTSFTVDPNTQVTITVSACS